MTTEEICQELQRRDEAARAEIADAAVKNRRKHILDLASDLPGDVLYYGEDEDLPRGAIEEALIAGLVTVEEIIAPLREALKAVTK